MFLTGLNFVSLSIFDFHLCYSKYRTEKVVHQSRNTHVNTEMKEQFCLNEEEVSLVPFSIQAEVLYVQHCNMYHPPLGGPVNTGFSQKQAVVA